MAVTGPPFFSIGQRVAVVGGKTSSITGRPTLPVFGSTATAPTYDTDAQAYFDAVVANSGAALSDPAKTAFNTYIIGLKADGVWSLLDRLAWFGNESSVAARVDVRTPTKLWAATGSPAFVAPNGYKGDGVGAYLNATDTLGTGTLYQQDDATIFSWINNQDVATGAMQQGGSSTQTSIALAASTTAGQASARINSSTAISSAGSPGSRVGFLCAVRDATTSSRYFSPTTAVAQQSTANPAATAPGGAYRALSRTTSFSTDRVLSAGYGKALTPTQVLALYTRGQTLAAALGCPLS